jgi:hypothetical protein
VFHVLGPEHSAFLAILSAMSASQPELLKWQHVSLQVQTASSLVTFVLLAELHASLVSHLAQDCWP